MEKVEAELLFEKYRSGKASAQEISKLLAWIQQFEQQGDVKFSQEELELVQQALAKQLPLKDKENTTTPWFKVVAVAASIFFVFLISYLLYQSSPKTNQNQQVKINDVMPGTNQATLTLADGRKILLTKYLKGNIAHQGEVSVEIDSNSSVRYHLDHTATSKSEKISYNTLTTKRGEQSPFPLVLSDGTKVWLNASSSLVFPANFSGSKREVQLNGEAYFEVAHLANVPFLVKSGNQVVQDIGTAFMISSYLDEPYIKTTLVEGAAKVNANGTSKMLKPGQQTQVDEQQVLLRQADVESETAWMKDKFIFRNEELPSIMRKLSRWYNIKVIYKADASHIVLGGGFSKERNISKVLKALEETGAVKFTIDGNTITVNP